MEQHKVIRSAFTVGAFTSLSRVLGLARDMLTAAAFGTSGAMSAFVVAFRIPNMFRALFGEGALSSAFVPIYTTTRQQEGDDAAWQFTRKVGTLLGATLLAIVLAGIGLTFLPQRLPGHFSQNTQVLPLMRIMLPYMLFICLTALSQGVLNSHLRFALPAFTPCLLNLTWIAFVLFVCPLFGETADQRIYGVAFGILVAGMVQLGAQIPAMWRIGWRPGLAWDLRDARVQRFLKLMAPVALGQSVSQVNMTINSFMALFATPWAASTMYFAERLLYFPQGILATAMSTVLLPVLSGHAAAGAHDRIRETLNHSLRILLFIMVPAAVGLLVLARPITAALLGWRAFDATSVDHATQVLQVYAPGLFVFGLAKVFVPAFYALQDTRTPFRNGLMAVGINFSLNLVCTLALVPELKAASLAAAAVLAEAFNGLTLGWQLRRRVGSFGGRGVLISATRSLAAAVAMGVAVWFGHSALTHALTAAGLHGKWLQFAALIPTLALGIAFYLFCAWLLRCPELGHVRDALVARRQRRAAPPSPSV
ncbi:MAG: murein biosynthesis integral membrane protein MurJ [Verrucomicrobia bacterium]|nr:MAG: murein biosynthesis integral membrane protein MurJ [Verrucomicrobiota bacterium]